MQPRGGRRRRRRSQGLISFAVALATAFLVPLLLLEHHAHHTPGGAVVTSPLPRPPPPPLPSPLDDERAQAAEAGAAPVAGRRRDLLAAPLAAAATTAAFPGCPAGAMIAAPPADSNEERLCESTVIHLRGKAGDVFLVGVAHLSNRSTELARAAVERSQPDLLMLELDKSRVDLGPGAPAPAPAPASAQPPASAAEWAAQEVGASLRGAAAGALRFVITKIYEMSESYLGERAGSEMVAAMEVAVRRKVPVLLGDQAASITLDRLVTEIGRTDMGKVDAAIQAAVPELGPALSDDPLALQSYLEGIRDQEASQRLRRAFQEAAPGLFAAMVGERDAYMAESLLAALRSGRRRVVAVVGSIHVAGIAELLSEGASLRVVDSCIA